MSKFKALTRITMVQVSLGVTAVTLCLLLGLIPDHRISQMEGRERLCESLALNGAVLVHQRDINRWQAIMDVLVGRHEDLLSAAIRQRDGKIVAETGNHQNEWPGNLEHSTDAFMQIPIHESAELEWGRLELRFTPLMPRGILMGFISHPWTRYSALFACFCFPLFYWNLRKVLRQLDPTKAVPRNVSEAYDFLAGAMVALNAQQQIIICNSAFVDMVGVERDQLLGKRLEELNWASKTKTEYPWHRVNQTRTHEYGVSLVFDSPSLGMRTLMVNAAPVIGQADNYAGTLVNFEDITPLEETKAELEKSKEEAEAANEAKSAFLANMSHEIRTPMNAILGFADIMRRGLDSSKIEREEYLGIIHSSGEHLLALINDILDLSKVESGSMQIELIECQPHVIVNDTLNTFAVRAKEKGIDLGYNVRTDIPEIVQSDPLRLRQILTNLVGNAIKFTESGGVTIEVELIRKDLENKLSFHVVDTGIGISQGNIEKVFKPFSQADSSTTRKFGGTGLGLSISRRLSELMGGGLSATSEVGKGSTFTVTIDVGSLDDANMLNAEQVKRQLSSVHRAEVKKQQLPPGKILVVDDGESNRRLVRLIMERAGATIDEAVDGQEAVEMVEANDYDVILMDVQMPRMDGTEAARSMRASGVDVPIVALTAHALGDEQKHILESGYSHLLTKPVNIDDLLALTAKLLGGELVDAPSAPVEADSKLLTDAAEASADPPVNGDCAPPTPTSLGEASQETGTETIPCDELLLPIESIELDTDTIHIDADDIELLEIHDIDYESELDELPVEDVDIESTSRVTDGNDPSSKFDIHAPRQLSQIKPDDAIESELPTDDEDFREIAEEFANRFLVRLSEMIILWSEKDYEALAKDAHWLKGSGGTAGFSELTNLGRQLEAAARARDNEACEVALGMLDSAARRLWVPKPQNGIAKQTLNSKE